MQEASDLLTRVLEKKNKKSSLEMMGPGVCMEALSTCDLPCCIAHRGVEVQYLRREERHSATPPRKRMYDTLK